MRHPANMHLKIDMYPKKMKGIKKVTQGCENPLEIYMNRFKM